LPARFPFMFRRVLLQDLYRVRGKMSGPLHTVGLASHIGHENFDVVCGTGQGTRMQDGRRQKDGGATEGGLMAPVMQLKIPGFFKGADATSNLSCPAHRKPGLFSCITVDSQGEAIQAAHDAYVRLTACAGRPRMGAWKTSNLPARLLRKSNVTLADILGLPYALDKTK
jgi:hypothetical protein